LNRFAFRGANRLAKSAQLSPLLNFVQLLVDQHGHKHQQKYTGTNGEHSDRNRKAVDLRQQFRLLFLHVRIGIIQKELLIFVHRESALVNQEDDQTYGENSEYNRH
jgi:hypothetical protein